MAKLLNWTIVTGMALLAVMLVVQTLSELSGPEAQLQMVRRPTMAQYLLLEDGMSYAAAVDVIGAEGAAVSRTALRRDSRDVRMGGAWHGRPRERHVRGRQAACRRIRSA